MPRNERLERSTAMKDPPVDALSFRIDVYVLKRIRKLRSVAVRERIATLCTRGFSSFVASTAALIATGWSEPVPGRV
jgi:hypothetical protein